MAIKIPIITELQDEGIKRAKREFDKFKGAVAGAEGGMGKLKAGSTAALDSIKANAATFATAAAGAFVTFAAKGVTAFQELALSADKFAGATGLAVEEASRLMEVTGDLGIEAGTVENAIGKMNQNLGKSPDLFKELGIQVEYAKDGTVNANETFLNVIDRLNKIKDPATKAKIATQVLGKSWRDMSNLIQMGSDDLRRSLATVSDAKVISPEEAERARKFRDNMDNLKDTVEDLSLQIGQVLVPVISSAVEELNKLQIGQIGGGFLQSFFGSPIDKFKGTMQMAKGLVQVFGFAKDDATSDDPLISEEEINNLQQAVTDLEDANQQTLNQIKYGKLNPFKGTTDSARNLAKELENVDKKWQALVDRFTATVAFDEAAKQLQIVEIMAMEAFGTEDADLLANYNVAAADLVKMLQGIASEMDNISSRAILMRFELQGPRAAFELAEWLKGGAEMKGLSQTQLLAQAGISTQKIGISQQDVLLNAGISTLAPGSPRNPIGGNMINITTSADPNQVVAAIQRWVRDNGAVPMTTTTGIRR